MNNWMIALIAYCVVSVPISLLVGAIIRFGSGDEDE